ncbi:MAG TPA: PDZ domain-containing protein [Thermomicrobiales bacterium]|nr:PDZ domain-containing protein [Thermomicrobiales bacterium]
MLGEVIGMNVATLGATGMGNALASGLNFAIDGNTVASIVDEIVATNASIPYPYLGVQTGPTQDGQVIAAVELEGPAGMEPGDIVIAVDGTTISDDTTFMDLLLDHRAGDTVELTISRDGEEQTLTVTLGTRPISLQAG